MTRTVADASRDYRKRQREKIERYEAALREIEAADAVEMALDPQWASRVANRALHIEV